MTKRLHGLWLSVILCWLAAAPAFADAGEPSAVACDPPFGLSSLDISTDRATLTWAHAAPASVTSFQLEIRTVGLPFNGQATHSGIAAPPFLLTSLQSGKSYRFRARAICGTDTSAWSATTHSFRTLFENPTRCGDTYVIADNLCPAPSGQVYPLLVQTNGSALGQDLRLRAVRLVVDHTWRSDLVINLRAPDGTTVRLIEGLNAGDTSLGNPTLPCPNYLELTNDPGALPLGAMFKVSYPTGRYQPRNPLAPFNNGQNPNGIWRLDICDQRAGKDGSFRWAELVFENLDCPAPTGVFVQNSDLNSAQIGWPGDATGCDSILVEWGPQDFLPGDGGQIGGGSGSAKLPCPASFPLTINGLAQFKWHDVYLRRHCGGGVWSANSEAVRVFTDCPPTLEEDFESQTICDKTCDAPCPLAPGGIWQNATSGDDYDWKIWQGPAPSVPNTGAYTDADGNANGKYLYFETTCPPSGTRDSTAILRSRCIQVGAAAGQSCHFAFDYFMWNTSSAASAYGRLAVDISLDGGLAWANLLTISGVQPKGWRHVNIPLGQFDGQVAVFRIVATGSVSQNSDILLDNLRFYGSTDVGVPDYVFYPDADSDGFGNPNLPLVKCSPDAPVGYVLDKTDCDDANAAAHPNAPEIICDGIDENCNGLADDAFIPAPFAADTAICAGQPVVLQAVAPPIGAFFWFEKATGGSPLASGPSLSVQNLTETTTYFLADSVAAGGCSSQRVPVSVNVQTTPRLLLDPDTAICSGQSFNLATLPVLDLAAAGGAFSYHSAFPPSPGNRLSGPVITPTFTTIYYIAATTSFGCRDVAELKVEVRPSPTATITTGDSTTICRNGTKKLVANPSGGTPPFSFAWSNGLNFQSIDVQGNTGGSSTTEYTVQVADAFGCTGTDKVKVHTLNSITQTEKTAVHNISTCGGSDGSITLRPLNGTPPYRFDWSGATVGSLINVASTGTIAGLPQGNYRITVSDATEEGCRMVMPLIVLNAPGLQVELDTLRHPACAGAPTGAILLKVQGTAPVFNWNNGSHDPNLDDIGEGAYSVTIVDGGCQQVLSDLEITAPAPLQILPNKITDIACFGGTSGAVDIAIFGGVQPYDVAWSSGAISEDIAGLASGNFSVSVTDKNGCIEQAEFLVNQPPALALNTTILKNVRCNGEANGEVLAQANGGTGGYFYQWSTGANTPFLNKLPAGTYTLTVADANGCTQTTTTEITQPNELDFGEIVAENPRCIGSKDGQITVQTTGGTAGYTYFWSNGQTTQQIDSLDIGAYSLTVIDQNGCQIFAENLTLDAPQLLHIELDTLLPVRCFGEANGLISISVAGGQTPLNVKWNGAADDLTLENAFPGTFTAVVTDAQGCTASRVFEVTQPANPLAINVLAQNAPNCYGEFSGFIETNVSGGWQPYQIQWSNGKNTQSISELPDGNYALTVTDAFGCTTTTGLLNLIQPAEIQAVPSPQNIPCNGSEGAILLPQVAGGQPPFRFDWSTGDTTQSVFGLPAGFFALTISDAAGCQAEFDSLQIFDTNLEFEVVQLAVENVSCNGFADGQIAVQLDGGAAPFRLAWSHLPGQTLSFDSRDTVFGLPPGQYELIVIDADGCITAPSVFSIQQSPALLWQPATVRNVPCKGESSGQIQPQIAGGVPPYQLDWGANTDPDSLAAGIYTATVTDHAGCTLVSPSLEITEPASALAVVVDTLLHDNCGQGRGAIVVHATGGTPQYAYQWSNGNATPSNLNLSAGPYSVQVTDHNNCLQTLDFQILKNPNPLVFTVEKQDVLCFGDSTGSIEVEVEGGTPGYEISWSNGASGTQLAHLPGGLYTLSLTDAAGCFELFEVTISQPAAPLAAIITTDSTALGWSLTAEISGGTASYSITWTDANGQALPSPTELPAGVYFADITDARGCKLRVKVFAGVVGTGEAGIFSTVNLSPNPTADALWLDLTLARPAALALEVFSVAGSRLAGPFWVEKTAALRWPLDWSGQLPGLYFLKITSDAGESRVLRFVKM
ncbi:MAG: MopE-related protein [Saprospiraceae bacterium]